MWNWVVHWEVGLMAVGIGAYETRREARGWEGLDKGRATTHDDRKEKKEWKEES